MTAQFGDRLLFEGQWRTLFANPLEDLFKAGFLRPYSVLRGRGAVTANWRGYIASWEIRDDELLLLDILSPVPTGKSTGAIRELFDEMGQLRPLCVYCRKPVLPGKPGHPFSEASFFCPHCGAYQHSRKCPGCGLQCDLAACFCPRCGSSLGEWRCDTCNSTAVDWMTARPPLPRPGFFCIRCGQEIPADEESPAETNIAPVRATWYTGVLQIPCGKRIRYVHMGYGSIYESDILFHVEEGRLIKQETRENTAEKRREKPDRIAAPGGSLYMPRDLKRWLLDHQEVLSSRKSHNRQGEPSAVLPPASLQDVRETEGPSVNGGQKDEQAQVSGGDASTLETEAYYNQVRWFFDCKKKKPPAKMSLVLSDGRHVHMTQLFQMETYAGHLVGMSTVASNRQLVERLAASAGKRIAGATRPHLIPPKVETYPGPGGETKTASQYRIPQILPSVACFAQLESLRPLRNSKGAMSCLTVVWFQDVFAFPIDPEVHQQLLQLDWKRLAVDSDY